MPTKVCIAVWSDYVCPFCYREEPVLERLREAYGEIIDVNWRAFELRPEPNPTPDSDGAYLYRVWNQSVYPMARERGIYLKLPPVQPRSRHALELAEFAREHGRFDEVHHALFRVFFEDGLDLSDIDVLLDIGKSNGLDAEELRMALEQSCYRTRVLADLSAKRTAWAYPACRQYLFIPSINRSILPRYSRCAALSDNAGGDRAHFI